MERKMYVAPELEVLEVMVEAGFQSSLVGDPEDNGGSPDFPF